MKKNIFLLFVVSLVCFLVGIYFLNSIETGMCSYTDPGCVNKATRIGNALFYGMGALTIVFIMLLTVPKAFELWKKFAIWYVPLATLLFIIYPQPGSGDLFSPYPEEVFRWFSILYVIVSVVLIAVHSFRDRRMVN